MDRMVEDHIHNDSPSIAPGMGCELGGYLCRQGRMRRQKLADRQTTENLPTELHSGLVLYTVIVKVGEVLLQVAEPAVALFMVLDGLTVFGLNT